MTVDMNKIRAALLESKNKGKRSDSDGKPRSTGDNASYRFWMIPVGSTATVRFLPDADPDNIFFWRERQVIKLPFEGVVGGEYPTTKKVEVTVPCVDMFPGMSCPIIAHTKPWWKDKAKEDMARLYYKKRSFIFQGFVVQSPMAEENLPENPIRRFVLNKSIFEIIEQALSDPDMEDAPVDYINGVDFKINKTLQGKHANYKTSTWARKSRSLSADEHDAINKHGLYTLKEYLGRVPDADEMEAIKAMFFDSLAGKPFDYDSFGKYYRAYGRKDYGDDDGDSTEISSSVRAAMAREVPSTSRVQEDADDGETYEEAEAHVPTPVAAAQAQTGGRSPHDILAQIKNRIR